MLNIDHKAYWEPLTQPIPTVEPTAPTALFLKDRYQKSEEQVRSAQRPCTADKVTTLYFKIISMSGIQITFLRLDDKCCLGSQSVDQLDSRADWAIAPIRPKKIPH